jgi:two-component system, OmpR family, response regulator RegX3
MNCENVQVKLLIVEDDPAIAEPLIAGLRHHGFEVKHVDNGSAAIAEVSQHEHDVVLLDLGLPDIDGLDVCREIRAISTIPIIMVTARNDEVDRVVGLELGADDYVVKPFGVRELIARVRAVRRRFDATEPIAAIGSDSGASIGGSRSKVNEQVEQLSAPIVLGVLEIDVRTHRVRINGVEISLTLKEYGVLAVLANDPGAAITRTSLLEQVWDEHWYGPTKTLDVHIAQVRQKLGDPRWIETVRGVGYRLVDANSEDANRQ